MSTVVPPQSPLRASTTSGSPTRGRDGHWWSSRQAIALLLSAGVGILEVLPLALGLELWASLGGHGPGDAVLPLWFLLLAMWGAQALGHALRRQSPASTISLTLPLLLLAEVLGLVTSPLAYAGDPGGLLSLDWLGALGHDLFTGSGRLNAVVGLTVVLCYVWWRGLRHGRRGPPTLDGLITLFKFSFAVVILEVILTVSVRGAGQAQLEGQLAVLLPLEVFVALATLSLARSHSRPSGSDGLGWVNPADERPWLSLALLLATGIVGVALLLSVILSYQNLEAALLGLGPVGVALNQGLVWLLYGFAYVLYLIFGIPIAYIKSLATGHYHLRIPRPPAPPKGACTTPNCAPSVPMTQGIYVAIFMGFVILALIALVAFIAYRTLRALRSRLPLDDVWETREDLGGSPLRDLLASLRRRRVPAAMVDGAPAHSVRRIYREVLQAAATAGLGRGATETA
ncbi:MAG TPA: hypothetical protein VGN32_15315, partial [Ktedonobacterales bacterium]|nr:hypothetical protein [Ktedonobacterales bacterium]